MDRWIPAACVAALLTVGGACTKANESTTTGPGATSAPAASSSTTASSSSSRASSGTTSRSGPGTTANTDSLGTWTAEHADGPLADDLKAGGHILCSFNTKGTLWDLQSADNDASYGTIDLIFQGDSDKADVEITTPGGKKDLAKGSATVSRTNGSGSIVSFGIGASYRMEEGGETGTFQVSGACAQERPRTSSSR